MYGSPLHSFGVLGAPLSGSVLRKRVAAEEKLAIAEAYGKYKRFAINRLRQLGRSYPDIDDLVQDTFLLLPQAARKCRPASSVKGCVAYALKRACWEFDRRGATRDSLCSVAGKNWKLVELAPLVWGRLPAFGLTPEEEAEIHEAAGHLNDLLMKMSEKMRNILVAHEIEGASTEELGRRFNYRTAGDVGRAVWRARARLHVLAKVSPLASVFAEMPHQPVRSDQPSLPEGSKASRVERARLARKGMRGLATQLTEWAERNMQPEPQHSTG